MRPDSSGADEISTGGTAIGGIGGIDDADAVLPPPPGVPVDPDDQLWHTASFATIGNQPAPQRKRKLTAGLACLGAATTAVCGYAGVELAGIAGLNPPSPPRYVIHEQANAQQGEAQLGAAPPAPPAPPPPPAPPQPPGVRPGAHAPRVPATTRGHKSGKDKSDSEKSGRHRKRDKSDD